MGGAVVVAVPVVVWTIAVPTGNGVVLWFDHDKVDWHDDRHSNQCDSSNGEGPNKGSLVERFGPAAREIARIREILLTNLWKKGGGVSGGIVCEVGVAWSG